MSGLGLHLGAVLNEEPLIGRGADEPTALLSLSRDGAMQGSGQQWGAVHC